MLPGAIALPLHPFEDIAMSLPALLSVQAVARLTGRTEATVRRWARGERPGLGVPAVRVGGMWAWRADDVERVLRGGAR